MALTIITIDLITSLVLTDRRSSLQKYNPIYNTAHYNAKGRFGEFLAAQPNEVNDPEGTMWTLFTTGPYMDM